MPTPQNAEHVWYDNTGLGRNLHGIFRRSLDVEGPVESGSISIFADTTYQLFVNGTFVDFGPVRADPRFPLFDTHDIAALLKPGRNAITVEVNFFGLKTYKAMPVRGGLIAWGSVVPKKGSVIGLTTGVDEWRAAPAHAHHRYAPKLSFALNACNIFDQAGEEEGYRIAAFDDRHWGRAVELDEQESWGRLAPRSIPLMSGEDVPVHRVLNVFPLRRRETIFSFAVPLPHFHEANQHDFSDFLAFSTWVYSPVDQSIAAGVFWSEGWLNGEALPPGIYAHDRPMRITQIWHLKKGWNYFFGKVRAYADVFQHYLGLPVDKGLLVSADRNPDSGLTFRHTPVVSAKDFETHLKSRALPYGPDDDLHEIGGWHYARGSEPAHNPCRETCWDEYGDPVEKLTPGQLQGHVFPRAIYPDGFAILLDLDYTRLMLPQIRLRGVAGALVDVTCSELLAPDSSHIIQQHHNAIGDRAICSRDLLDWMPTQPRGTRYLMITVRGPHADVTLESLKLRSATYPVTRSGAFNCSDPTLNAIWEMGARTQSANMEDAYVDCVGRERGMYGRDTIIQYHVNLATYGDHKLMQRCMELYGQSPDATGKFRAVYPNTGDYTISDFALNMLEGYLAYYEFSGDVSRIRGDWAAMRNNLAWFHNLADDRKDMLLDSEWHTRQGVAAHYGGFHGDLGIVKGHMDNQGIHCVFSCTYLIALRAALKLARVLGEKDDERELLQRIRVLEASIPTKFWNARKGCFSDNLKRSSHSVHASLFAVRAGVVSKSQLVGVRAHVGRELRSLFVNGTDPHGGVLASPSYCFYILDGLYQAGLLETAENLIRQGWGWCLAVGLRTCPEYFKIESSLCHAWSASPTYYLSRKVLGVEFPVPTDMNRVAIKVQTAGVQWAEGAWPHPRGTIRVKWHMEGRKRVFDYVKVPRGVTVVSAT